MRAHVSAANNRRAFSEKTVNFYHISHSALNWSFESCAGAAEKEAATPVAVQTRCAIARGAEAAEQPPRSFRSKGS